MNWLSARHPRFPLIAIMAMLLFTLPGLAFAHHCKGAHASDPTCDGGGGGGSGSGGEDTAALSLVCSVEGDQYDSLLGDNMGDYLDGVDKVNCGTGDSQESHSPSHVRFKTVAQGNVRNAIRKVDLVIDEGTCSDVDACETVPDGVFASAGVNVDDMEDVAFAIRAYAGASDLDVPHIQSLNPGYYQVSMNFNLLGMAERWVFQMMDRDELPADFKQGSRCDLANPADARSDDVTLYVWPDDNLDGKPDGFTVTTAAVDSLDTSVRPPQPPEVVNPLTDHLKTATLCSNVGVDGSGCGGPGGSDLCHLISKMKVRFTLHAENP